MNEHYHPARRRRANKTVSACDLMLIVPLHCKKEDCEQEKLSP